MENNQHNSNKGKGANSKDPTSLKNQQPGQQLPGENETNNASGLAETSGTKEQHSDRGSSQAENETLGTP